MDLSDAELARLWSKIDQSGGPKSCWPWVSGCKRFYVRANKAIEFRRVVWFAVNGALPPGVQHVEVTCGNAKCCNPAHLEAPTLETRFWRFVRKSPKCWEWTGGFFAGGYGTFTIRHGVNVRASRFAWELHYGPIEGGLLVCHKCDNTKCVRPSHLFLGTDKDNHDDMVSKGRHARGEKLSVAVRAARAARVQLTPHDSPEDGGTEK